MLTRMLNDFAPLFRMHEDMSRLSEAFFEDLPGPRAYAAGYPALNTWEDADGAWLEAELPGLSIDDVEILVKGNEVTIAGERKLAQPEKANWHRRERTQGRFARTIALPWDVNEDAVRAMLRDGVLTVQLPKAESAKPKKIKVLGA